MKRMHLLAGLTSVIATACLLVIALVARAETPPAPGCPPSTTERYCVAAPVHSAREVIDGTRYVLTTEITQAVTVVETYYDSTGTAILTQTQKELPPRTAVNFYVRDRLPATYTGTLVLTGTGQFTLQTIDPLSDNCPNTSITARCDFSVYLTAGATGYTLLNTDSVPVSQTHDIYRDGVFAARVEHNIPPFSQVTFTIPGTHVQARDGTMPAPPRYNVNVKPKRSVATPPPATAPPHIFIPLITRH